MFDFISVHFFILFSRTIILQFVPLFANSTHKCNFLNYTPAGASLQLVPNSEFTILSSSLLSHSSHLPHSSHLSQPSQPSHSSHQSNPSHTSHLSHLSHSSHNSKFIIQNSKFSSHYLERIIGFKNSFLYGG